MKIGCLQFSPSLGQVDENILKADRLLQAASSTAKDLDILVLPELAFSGYNFPSLEAIQPCLEPTATGPSAQWTKRTAEKLNCIVVTGYPEDASSATHELQVHAPERSPLLLETPYQGTGTPVVPNISPEFPPNFNSCVAFASDGTLLVHYRKSSLYYTDATWGRQGSGFWSGRLQIRSDNQTLEPRKSALGICMDINPHNFTNPWDKFEFANHVIQSDAELVILSMAWLSRELTEEMLHGSEAFEPDTFTLLYWIERFRPLLEMMDGKLRILVMANRCGNEGEACYAGSSAVIGIKDGEVFIWDMCGKGEDRLMVVDTSLPPKYRIRTTEQQADDEDYDDDDDYDNKVDHENQ